MRKNTVKDFYDTGYETGFGGQSLRAVGWSVYQQSLGTGAGTVAYKAGWADGHWDRSQSFPRGASYEPPRIEDIVEPDSDDSDEGDECRGS